jgi:shikimate dehydrogenase
MKKTCVIGWPIAHSRSPLIHDYWMKRHGIHSAYEKVAVKPVELQAFFTGFLASPFKGCNVTIPHKEAAFHLIKDVDERASRLRAVNTICVRDGRLHGTNTDGEGFLGSLKQSFPDIVLTGSSAVILGAGGSAKAVIGALLDAGVAEITVINRTAARIDELISMFGPKIGAAGADGVGTCDLLIQATPMGMEGQLANAFDFSRLNPSALVADLVYTPLKTQFLAAAEARGHRILPGLGMLLHQAVRGFELWHGVRPDVTQELYELVAADVAKAQPA